MSSVENIRAATLASLARRWVTGEVGFGPSITRFVNDTARHRVALVTHFGSDRFPATPSRSVVADGSAWITGPLEPWQPGQPEKPHVWLEFPHEAMPVASLPGVAYTLMLLGVTEAAEGDDGALRATLSRVAAPLQAPEALRTDAQHAADSLMGEVWDVVPVVVDLTDAGLLDRVVFELPDGPLSVSYAYPAAHPELDLPVPGPSTAEDHIAVAAPAVDEVLLAWGPQPGDP